MGKLIGVSGRVLGLSVAVGLGAALAAGTGGCQVGPTVATKKLVRHQARVEKDGLDDVQALAALKVMAAPPENWVAGPLTKGPLYTHQQWRSHSRATGVGVVYVKLPIPLPMSTLLFFAKQEYTKKGTGGRLIAQWSDHFGRQWFEAENDKYHVRGYAMLQGTDAWIVYSGYRTTMPVRPEEVSLAERCQETIMIRPKAAAPSAAHADARD